jgi:hypothetical protein
MKAQTYLPLFSGFYNSHWDDIDFYDELDLFNIPSDMTIDDFVDWDKYHNHIAKEMCNEVQYLLSDFVSDIKFEKIVSPRYYNFENDSIDCEIDFNEEKVMEYLNENQYAFSVYIRERYTSRDGFISSYENNASEWLHEWQNDSHKVGSILQFICANEGFEEPWDLNDTHISLFYNQQIYQYERENSSN